MNQHGVLSFLKIDDWLQLKGMISHEADREYPARGLDSSEVE